MNETLFLPAGDSAVNVEFGRTIDPEINKKIRGLSDSLSRKPIRGVTECIPTFRSLLVCYDPLQTGCEALIKKLKKRAVGSSTFKSLSDFQKQHKAD